MHAARYARNFCNFVNTKKNYEFFATKNIIFKRMSFYLAESYMFVYIPQNVPLTANFNFTRCFENPHLA